MSECIRAFCYLYNGFEEEIKKGQYKVIVTRNNRKSDIGPEELSLNLGRANHITIKPVFRGRKRGGLGKIVLGVLLVGFAWWMAPTMGTALFGGALGANVTYGTLAMVGGMMALNGVSAMLTPKQKATSPEDQKASFILDATGNLVEQGNPVPIVFGEVYTGSVVVSTGMSVEELANPVDPDDENSIRGNNFPTTASNGDWFIKTGDLIPSGSHLLTFSSYFVFYNGTWYRYGYKNTSGAVSPPPIVEQPSTDVLDVPLWGREILISTRKLRVKETIYPWQTDIQLVTTLPTVFESKVYLYFREESGVNTVSIAAKQIAISPWEYI